MSKFKKSILAAFGLSVLFLIPHTVQAQTKPEEKNPTYKAVGNASSLGIGDIVMSILDLPTFQAQHGGGSTKWVVANGDKYPDSAWAILTGNNAVPDLTNRYPRGYAAGLPGPGGHMEDAILQHSHQMSGWAVMNDARGSGDNHVLRTGYPGNTPTSEVLGAATGETRPKTTVVIFYIRIN